MPLICSLLVILIIQRLTGTTIQYTIIHVADYCYMLLAVVDYERNIACSNDPKRFWRYVKLRQKPHPKVCPLYDAEVGSITNDPKICV